MPEEIRILGIAIYFQTSSFRRTVRNSFRIPQGFVQRRKEWIKKIEERLPIATEKKQRNPIALDETVVKANKKRYYVYAAIDVEKNELILMRVYTTRNNLTAKSFVREVLNYCENGPRFVIDKAPWLKRALESLNLGAQGFGRRSLLNPVFSSFKQRVKVFFCSITAKKGG